MKHFKRKRLALRSMAAVTSAAMIAASFSCVPVGITAFAEDPIISSVISAPEYDDYDSAELLNSYIDHYVMEGLGYPSFSPFNFNDAGRDSLRGEDLKIYDLLLPEIKKIASGDRASSSITVSYTRENSSDTNSLSKVMAALRNDCPYELYWFDKTEGVGTRTLI
ncbi:MAG: hypothetical protein MSJ26_02255 [Oscillospiraceae bacterium]|nr:hypothetical protein [Oscillospiraceae bacterium]